MTTLTLTDAEKDALLWALSEFVEEREDNGEPSDDVAVATCAALHDRILEA
jgi:hypothetical protein